MTSARLLSVTLAIVAVSAPGLWASAANTLSATYNPSTGTIDLKVLDESGQPATLNISAFQILSPSQYLSGSAALIPGTAASFATILNTDTSSYFDPPKPYAEIYANALGGTLFSSTWSLGPVAQTGLSQGNVNAGFSSNPDLVAPAVAGGFNYEVGGANWFSGTITVVPEPAALAMAGAATACLVGAHLSRRRLGPPTR